MTYAAEYELTMRRCYRLGREADRLARGDRVRGALAGCPGGQGAAMVGGRAED